MMRLYFFSRLDTPAETNSKFTPENGWLEEDRFLLGWPIFKGELLVSGSVVDYKQQLLENFCSPSGYRIRKKDAPWEQ